MLDPRCPGPAFRDPQAFRSGKTGPQAGGDSGTYKFDKGGYCSSWKKLRSGAEKCFTAEKLDNGYQLWTLDGKKDDTLTSQ